MDQAGSETTLLEMLRLLKPEEYEISLYVLMGQGEMVHEIPEYVKLLNKRFDAVSVLSREGKGCLRKNVLRALFSRGTIIRLLPYMMKNFLIMLKRGRVLFDKLLWRALSDGGERFDTRYDLAVAYLEGGSTYYVANHVNADKKAAFVHVDYGKAGYTRELDGACYLSFDKVFTVSDEVRKAFLNAYPECGERTEVFHNILNPERIRRKAQLTEGFDDGYEGMRILSVGRLTAQKAFEISIEAMKLLKDKGEKVRWYVLGDGDQRKNLEEKVKQLGLEEDFLMPGAVGNPYPYMAQTDIYVHASRFEGKSIAIQEAQILGKPILVSDCSGNREQVVPNVDGLMCELTPEGICQRIEELLHDEAMRLRLGAAAQKRNAEDEAEIGKLFSML